jgi:hypothetical protein
VTLEARIREAPANGLGFRVDGEEGPTVVRRDCRIYGEGSPWWGPARISALTVGEARVLLERLTVGDLVISEGYLSTVRDVVVQGLLQIGQQGRADHRSSSAVVLESVHVRGGGFALRACNAVWVGGSIERTTRPMWVGKPEDTHGFSFMGVRFEHDSRAKILVDSVSR